MREFAHLKFAHNKFCQMDGNAPDDEAAADMAAILVLADKAIRNAENRAKVLREFIAIVCKWRMYGRSARRIVEVFYCGPD